MRIDRLIGIIMTLLDQKRVGAQELARQFEVSPRTIYRDIETINLAGVPIRSTPGVGGGFEIMPEYKVDNKVFSTADLSAILMGLSSLSHIIRGNELVNALAKIRTFIPPDRVKDIEMRSSQICIDPGPWLGGGNIQPHLQTIQTALAEHRLLSFSYIAHHGEETVRTVEPCQLVFKGGHWYFYGYCRSRKDYRLFRLSRIIDLQMKQETFLPRAPQSLSLDFTETAEALQGEIKLRVHRSILDRVLAFCPYDRFTPATREHYLVAFPFIENEYYYDILLGFGDKCECLAPPHIREGLRQRVCRLAALYER